MVNTYATMACGGSLRDLSMYDDIFLCSICLQPFSNPKLLPCLHSFCEVCLERHFDTCKVRAKGKITCPGCRATVGVPRGKISCFRDDESICRIERFIKCFEDFESSSDERCGTEEQKDLGLDCHAMESRLVTLRQHIQHLHLIEDHIHNTMEELLLAAKNEPKSRERLKAEVEESYRPVQAKIVSKLDKLYCCLYDLKGAYGITEGLVEKASPQQIRCVYKDLKSWINKALHATDNSVNVEISETIRDLSVAIPDISGLMIPPDNGGSKVLSLRAQSMLVMSPVCAVDGYPKLIFKISQAGERPGQFYFPVNATFIPTGGFLVCDKNNLRLQIFDEKGRFVRFLQNRRLKPRRARVNPADGLVYVSDEQTESIRVVTLDDQYVGSIGGKYFSCAAGLAFNTKGHILMCDAEKATATMFLPDGKMIGKFCAGFFEKRMPCPYFVASNSEDHIIVSDCRNNWVKAFTSQGREIFRISDLKCPRGVCVDADGNILVAEGDGHCVSLYSMFGKFLCYLLTEKDGLRYPMSVDMNDAGQILVTQFGFFHQEVLLFQIDKIAK